METVVRAPQQRGAVLAISLAAVAVVAAIGGIANAGNTDGWYAAANKPAGTPPGWVFGPVWTTLYLAMAVAAWRVWSRSGPTAALGLYVGQLVLNALWSPVFFAAEQLWTGLAILVALDVLVGCTVAGFARVDRVAARLLAPYLVWILYATYLNAGIAAMN